MKQVSLFKIGNVDTDMHSEVLSLRSPTNQGARPGTGLPSQHTEEAGPLTP